MIEREYQMFRKSVAWYLTYVVGLVFGYVLVMWLWALLSPISIFLMSLNESFYLGPNGVSEYWIAFYMSIPICIFMVFTTIYYLQMYLVKRQLSNVPSSFHISMPLSLVATLAFFVYLSLISSFPVPMWANISLSVSLIVTLTIIGRLHIAEMRLAGYDTIFWSVTIWAMAILSPVAFLTPLAAWFMLILMIIHSHIPSWTINYAIITEKSKRKRKNDQA